MLNYIIMFIILTILALLLSYVCVTYNKKFHIFPWIGKNNPKKSNVFIIYFVILEIAIATFTMNLH